MDRNSVRPKAPKILPGAAQVLTKALQISRMVCRMAVVSQIGHPRYHLLGGSTPHWTPLPIPRDVERPAAKAGHDPQKRGGGANKTHAGHLKKVYAFADFTKS